MSLTLIILCSVIGLTSGVGVLPDSVNATLGGTVTFNTTLAPTETPHVSIIWNFKDVIIVSPGYTNPQYKDRITLFTSTGSLELRNLVLSDAGDYSVTVQPAGATPETGRTTLNIYEPVSNVNVTVTDTDLVEFRDTVTLSCTAASGSPQSFLWFNGSAEVTPSDRVQFTNGGANVTITVLRYDEGPYSCKASNPASSSTSGKVELSISYGPESVNLKTPTSDAFLQGSIVPLTCLADSRPEAQFKWLLNGKMLSYTGAKIFLVIRQSGNYSCQAFNSKTQKNETSQPAEFTVFKKIQNASVQASNPPVEEVSVNLTCDASGDVNTRKWTLRGTEVKPSGNIELHDENRVLSFRNVTRKNSGIYTCRISNPVSSDSFDYILDVIYGPEKVKISGPMAVEEGTTLTLSCWAETVPKATYTWTKNGTTLTQSPEYTKHNIKFSDSGEYVCRATNEITMNTLKISHAVNVTEAPEVPEPGLSRKAVAGISVASAVVVVAGATIGGFCLYKHIKARK